jgi:hypothetical protein
MKTTLLSLGALFAAFSLSAMHTPRSPEVIRPIQKLYSLSKKARNSSPYRSIPPQLDATAGYIINMVNGPLRHAVFEHEYQEITAGNGRGFKKDTPEEDIRQVFKSTLVELERNRGKWKQLLRSHPKTATLFGQLLDYSQDVLNQRTPYRHADIIKKELSAADMTRPKKRKALEQPRAPCAKKPIKQVPGQQKLDSFFGKK